MIFMPLSGLVMRWIGSPGVALWTCEDWSPNMRGGWVPRLGVPGPDAFGVTSDAALRADLSTDLGEILASIVRRASETGGATAHHLNRLFEYQACGVGRALWRDILISAPASILGDGTRGTMGRARVRIEAACRDTGTPLPTVTDGAGVLVLDAQIEPAAGPRPVMPDRCHSDCPQAYPCCSRPSR